VIDHPGVSSDNPFHHKSVCACISSVESREVGCIPIFFEGEGEAERDVVIIPRVAGDGFSAQNRPRHVTSLGVFFKPFRPALHAVPLLLSMGMNRKAMRRITVTAETATIQIIALRFRSCVTSNFLLM
jgi:hypothetical protein